MAETGYVERFRSASPARQGALVVAVVFAIAAVAWTVWFFVLRTPYMPLFTGVRAPDAATIVAALDELKVPYRLAEGGTTILAPADRVDATRLTLMGEDLPLKGTVGFELFNESDLGLTDFAQKINYQRALQGELARTIMTLDGVDTARVHLSMGEERIFRDDRVPPKASVVLRMKQGGVPEGTAWGIQRLVAAAVPQLDPASVVVLDEAGKIVGIRPETSVATSAAGQERRTLEQYYAARVREAIARQLPGMAVDVAVTALRPAGEEVGPALAWSPRNRRFPLQVRVSAASLPSPEQQARMRQAAAAAIGSTATSGDTIVFATGPEVRPAPARLAASSSPPAAPAANGPAVHGSGWLWLAAVGAALALCFVALGALLAAARRRGGMSADARAAFAARLSAALEREEGRHAA
jgi:flagellar M-ring protein FliF